MKKVAVLLIFLLVLSSCATADPTIAEMPVASSGTFSETVSSEVPGRPSADNTSSETTVSSDPSSEPSAPVSSADVSHSSSGTTSSEPFVFEPDKNRRLSAFAAVLYSVDDDRIVYGKNIDVEMYPASMTKLMTALTALRLCGTEELFTVDEETLSLVESDASVAKLKAGMTLNLEMLLEAMLLPSGCDASYVIAVGIGRKLSENPSMPAAEAVKLFVAEMNGTAADIGVRRSHFANPDGYHHDELYITAREMAIIAAEAKKVPLIDRICSELSVTRTIASGQTMVWKNHNALLKKDSPFYMPGADGLKTGYTSEAGNCISVSAELDGKKYIGVLFACPDGKSLWSDAHTLFLQRDSGENLGSIYH